MTVRRFAKCTSPLPTGEIEEEGEFVQLGGGPLSIAIAEDLRAFGCIVDEPGPAGLNGWASAAQYRGRNFWYQVTLIDDYYLVFGEPSFWSKLLRRKDHIFTEFLRRVGMALRDDPRIQDIRWYLEMDDGSEGAADPV